MGNSGSETCCHHEDRQSGLVGYVVAERDRISHSVGDAVRGGSYGPHINASGGMVGAEQLGEPVVFGRSGLHDECVVGVGAAIAVADQSVEDHPFRPDHSLIPVVILIGMAFDRFEL